MRMPWIAALVIGLAASLTTSAAHADVDLTGAWVMEGFGEVVHVAIVQTGTSMTLQIESNDPMTGTIDPATGAFSLVGVPHPGGVFPVDPPFPYGPSPAPTLHGTASADGTHFDGLEVEYIIKITPPVDFSIFPWFGIGFDVHATRAELVVCGDGDVDPGETCDDGVVNGLDGCCSATCTRIDADFDGVCDAQDNCPTTYNPLQDPVCVVRPPGTLALSSARLGQARIRVRGVLADGAVTDGLRAIAIMPGNLVASSLVCTPKPPRRMICAGGAVRRLRLSRRGGEVDWRMDLDWRTSAPLGSVTGPVSVDVGDAAGFHWTDTLTTCTTTASALSCVE